jgi:hypothetical protein
MGFPPTTGAASTTVPGQALLAVIREERWVARPAVDSAEADSMVAASTVVVDFTEEVCIISPGYFLKLRPRKATAEKIQK